MIANKMDIEELKEVGGGWVHKYDDTAYYVLDDHTAEILDGPFNNPWDADVRAMELGQNANMISPAILEYLRNKNK